MSSTAETAKNKYLMEKMTIRELKAIPCHNYDLTIKVISTYLQLYCVNVISVYNLI